MFKSLVILAAAANSVYGHAFINAVQGANGVTAVGLGVTFNGEVTRGGTTEQPFQLDTPVLKDTATDPCGATLLAGSVNIATAMTNVQKAFGGFPTIPKNNVLTMGVFQVNADGGGPFAAEINTDATGASWKAITVTSQPPGVNGILHNGPANSSITVQIPAGTKCTGPSSTCLIRLNNGGQTSSLANGAGPFGGCVAVSQANAATNTNKNGKGKGANRNGNGNKANALNGRHFYPSLAARSAAVAQQVERDLVESVERALAPLMETRALVEREIAEKRQHLTAQLIDELSTATGTAIDIPIDRMAGHDDAALNGGNSTAPVKPVLTEQQAIDLKKAVQTAIGNALELIASTDIDAGVGGQNSDITDATNAAAAAAFVQAKSINAGNAGVGFFNTQNVDSLLGQLATASAALAPAAATATAAAGAAGAAITPAPAAAAGAAGAAATQAAGRNGNGNGRGGNNNNRRYTPRRFWSNDA